MSAYDSRLEVWAILPLPADQRWFWTERWQAMEREADADTAAGRIASVTDVDNVLDDLDS